jgi:hypothetical protein
VNVEQQIETVLTADVTVAGLVAARVYPLLMPQGVTMPAISYQRVATALNNDLEGTQNHEWVRVQVDCWASTYAQAKTLAAAVRTGMRTTPLYGQLLLELDDYDSDEKLYRVIQDFNVWN